MDNVTHTLFALTLARTPLRRAGRGATAALVLASNAPDVDIVAALKGGTNYLAWHRGPSHGPLGILALGVLVAGIVWGVDRFAARPPAASWQKLLALSLLGVTAHILMDLPTSYGTRWLSPFTWQWFALDWLPIVDVYLLVVLAAGLAFGRTSDAARRRNVAIALALMAANYGLRGAAHHEALALAPRLFGPTLPAPCDPPHGNGVVLECWPQPSASAPAGATRCLVEMAAIPTFVSPFRWRVIAHLSDGYEIHEVDLLDARFQTAAGLADGWWRRGLRFPNRWTPAVTLAAGTQTARVFLGFSRFPDAQAVDAAGGGTTVRWIDMRFAGGMLTLEPGARRLAPFTVTVRLAQDGRVLEERLGP